MEKSVYSDLEEVRLNILKQKIQDGLTELNNNPGQQWTPLRCEKPLLETLLRLVEKEFF